MLRKSLLIVIVACCFPAMLHATEAAAAAKATPAAGAAAATQAAATTKAAPPCDDGSTELGPPSPDAKDMPGALGTCELKPSDWQQGVTTYWKDSDGVAPGMAGCHLGTNASGQRNNRQFGEACRHGNAELIESNPKINELHAHQNDLGHPDVFSCAAWCRGTGHSGGSCVTTNGPPPCQQSAWCQCTG